nr:immunoglobulin light chain junction region [Macaca mulatta]MOX18377.1 immunoglobulin light chain junction region [Macaca mulatta]MOX18842.1 immunoglobulin light chain junction region [Macaca mulatta]MOX19744.1 immunoglobulin light chain junction region [Macaca mulatta]MOX19790.1 immunoglobulin light chain junction region [Macaca mulatta]
DYYCAIWHTNAYIF